MTLPARAAARPHPGPRPAEAAGTRSSPISRVVEAVAAACPGERITLGEMTAALGERGFGLLILVLLLPSLLPGMSMLFGLPVILLGAQMGLGLRVPRLPAALARRSIRRADLERLSGASSRWLGAVERLVRPRPGPLVGRFGERLFGWLAMLAGVMLVLPGPGTNGPPAFGAIVMALGLIERDNRTLAIGVALTLAGSLFAAAVVGAMAWAALHAASWLA